MVIVVLCPEASLAVTVLVYNPVEKSFAKVPFIVRTYGSLLVPLGFLARFLIYVS